jgi:multiple sugar transport system ATP-binding protein
MASVVLENLCKTFPRSPAPDLQAVQDVCLAVDDKEFVVLVGPSGCGKTTSLRLIAGLESVTSGVVRIDGADVNRVPPKDRDVAMVFQNYALYPHMTVFENMAFGLRMRKVPKQEIQRLVHEAAHMLDLVDQLPRKPHALSGGQRQRVAVGRAIVRKPRVFLFDEPLSNLDAPMRVQMRAELSRLHRRLGATMIYDTHDQVEAMTLGDRIVVMREGRVQQVAPPAELYLQPANAFVAGFIGSPPMNLVRGTLRPRDQDVWFEEQPAPPWPPSRPAPLRVQLAPRAAAALQGALGRPILLGLRPEHLAPILAPLSGGATPDASNAFDAEVELVEMLGAEILIHCLTGSHRIIAHAPLGARRERGTTMTFAATMEAAAFFDPDSGGRMG